MLNKKIHNDPRQTKKYYSAVNFFVTHATCALLVNNARYKSVIVSGFSVPIFTITRIVIKSPLANDKTVVAGILSVGST